MAHVSSQLGYAPQTSWRHRKVARRAVIAGALLLGLLASIKWISPAWNHARLLYYQSRCLGHVEPADNVVYDSMTPPGRNLVDWERFYALFSPPGGRYQVPIFVHELRHKDGSKRLVIVEASGQFLTRPNEFPMLNQNLECTTIEPGGIWSHPQLRYSDSWKSSLKLWAGGALQFFAGQIDSSDSTHFTIQYGYAGHREIIDGWLQKDESILLELRNSPLSTNK